MNNIDRLDNALKHCISLSVSVPRKGGESIIANKRAAERRRATAILEKTYPFHSIKDTAAFDTVLNGMKKGAIKRNLDWKITDEQAHYIMQRDCDYCGCEPKQGINRIAIYGYAYNGLDRVNNKKGYTISNLIPCCGICNSAKGKQSVKEFETWINRIYNNFIGKHNVPKDKHYREILLEDLRE